MAIAPTALVCHPSTLTEVAARVEASVQRVRGNRLSLHYALHGDIDRVRMPAAAAAERMDGLWEHTCFEAFIAAADQPAYYEFNFSPSCAWAAYRFNGYREGMHAVGGIDTPEIKLRLGPGVIEINVRVGIPEDIADRPLRVALAAVIEQRDRQRSYWALHHPREKPDFHQEGGFTMRLAAPAQARARKTRS
jgi:hypothetical protein